MKKECILIYITFIITLVIVSISFTYSYFVVSVRGTGNTNNNTSSVTTATLGEIRYDGELIFTTNDIYPGYKDIQIFEIGPYKNGEGIYEIDLEAIVPDEFKSDIEITLYKTIDSTNNYITRIEGILTQDGSSFYKEDDILITGNPEIVYSGILINNTRIKLEQEEFSVPGIEDTTYYLIYDYKNKENQSIQENLSFSGKITVSYILSKST